ncbi:MAG TPA: GNAT family N-acetyltransferase [Ohtaekwangia sp.]|uniref:GNAT family N-acetyltransferase n=1 Tax=Ohtaekwangia sp. TaxID=2066019 RepID=UPI002F9509D7
MSSITYHDNRIISAEQFVDVLDRSTLARRRPVHDEGRISRMLKHANILITAWDGEKLVGVSRALSDFSYCCYLSDLAVDVHYQKQGIGKELIQRTRDIAGENASLILLAAPDAVEYYPKIGMENFNDCFIIRRKSS